jgi:hypothetical protein
MRAFLGFLIFSVLAVAVVAPTAVAYHAPTKAERTKIVAAIRTYLVKCHYGATHTCHPRISGVRVSLANRKYATAVLNVPRPSESPHARGGVVAKPPPSRAARMGGWMSAMFWCCSTMVVAASERFV